MSDTAISIDNVSKLFRKQNQRTFKEMLPAFFGGKKVIESFWALRDINLEIKKGETVGIIGPNGSGKSTLLKLIAGVSQPTTGKITVNGRIAPLIELGAGFHPELTGRENVYLNGVILGMSRKEVEAKFKDIVDFGELWEFIDQPVKHYSSGMYFRLAFSVAIFTSPDILLVDEIFAVGDVSFQEKCYEFIHDFRKTKTMIIVTHDMNAIKQMSTKTVLFNKGQFTIYKDASEAIDAYKNLGK